MTSTQPRPLAQVAADPWEAAYLRFETPEEEERKFIRRLVTAGARAWDKDAVILDLFCGRGGGARAFRQLGFRRIVGLDLSPRLLAMRTDALDCVVADCRALPVATRTADIAVVQGGLHHLPRIPHDLSLVLGEVTRALRPGGLFVVVEPWTTPFLTAVHWVSRKALARRALRKIDALATMIEHERQTYEAWLGSAPLILAELDRRFERHQVRERLGKLLYVGTPRHV